MFCSFFFRCDVADLNGSSLKLKYFFGNMKHRLSSTCVFMKVYRYNEKLHIFLHQRKLSVHLYKFTLKLNSPSNILLKLTYTIFGFRQRGFNFIVCDSNSLLNYGRSSWHSTRQIPGPVYLIWPVAVEPVKLFVCWSIRLPTRLPQEPRVEGVERALIKSDNSASSS